MNTKRIEEIQKETAYPDSISVQQALLKVWNECEQEKVVNKNDLLPDVRLSFVDLKDEILKYKAKSEYQQASIVILRNIFKAHEV